MRNYRSALLALTVCLGASLASAQTELSGSVSDDTTGPLLAGQVYHLTGSVSVPSGKTLTVEPGAIVKGRTSAHLVVHGTLDVNGTPGNQVIFTSITDDIGGDTGLDGPTTGTPGEWRGLYLYSTASASTVSNAEFRYCGAAGYSAIVINGPGTQWDGIEVMDCSVDGINLSGQTATITGCDVTGSGGVAIQNVPLQTVPLFSGLTASNNAGGNYTRITSFTHTEDLTIGPANCIDDTLVFAMGGVTVASGKRLTFGEGLVFKANNPGTHLVVHGTFESLGTALNPVVYTTLEDDSVGGDAANDGFTMGAQNAWRGLFFYSTSTASRIEYSEVKFTGNAGYAPFTLNNALVAIDSCLIHQNGSGGIDFSNGSTGATVVNTTIENNTGIAIINVPLQALPFLSGNSATGNSSGDYIRVTNFTHNSDVEIVPDNVLNNLMVCTNTITVAGGWRLTLGAGLILKFVGASHVTSHGELHVQGTTKDPVIFTSIGDDAYGGDTPKDGPTTGTPGDWRGFYFYSTSLGSDVESAVLRYTGNAGYAGISLHTEGINIINSTVENGSAAALHQVSGGGGSVVAGCYFLNNAGMAATNVSVNSLVHFRDNIVLGNAGGNFTQVTNANPVGDVILKKENIVGDLLYITAGFNIGGGHSLTFEEDMILKLNPATHLVCNSGALRFLGTPEGPIVVTSFYDDDVVGDSDLGAGPPAAPGDWRGIYLYAGASFTARHLKMSYVGNAGYAGIYVSSPMAVLDHVEVRHSQAKGFEFLPDMETDPTHLTAFDCATNGIFLRSGSCTIRRSTVVGSGAEGIVKLAPFSGRIADTISYGNTLDNFSGFRGGALRYCNGSPIHAGSRGNIDQDPLFVDQLNGDLNLQMASPCVDTGNPQAMTDPDGTRADMGSHYYNFDGPNVYCGSKQNSLGCLPEIGWTGDPTLGGADDFHVTAINIIPQQPGYLLSSLNFNSGSKNGLGASLLGTHLCSYNPKVLTGVNSGGTSGVCDGTFDVHFTQAMMATEGLLVGQTVYTQYVFKDPPHPDGSGWGHTNALRFQVAP